MRVLLATVQVPFITGGAEALTSNLQSHLRKRRIDVDTITLPFKWYPAETILQSMVTSRMLDLTEVNGRKVDLLIGLKFPAYYAPHPNKVIWLIHQHRQAYDLWDTEFGDIHLWKEGEYVRKSIIASDTRFLSEARRIFTISQNVSDRLRRYNGLASIPLYSPPEGYQKLACAAYEPFIFYPSRIDAMKRQHELVEAARYMKSGLRILIAGTGPEAEVQRLRDTIRDHALESRVSLLGYISQEEKIDLLARCLAVYFGGYDEDYGYVTLEAMFSRKPVVTHGDCGGALEFVRDGENGCITESNARALAECLDELAGRPEWAKKLGSEGLNTVRQKNVSWDHVVDSLLEAAYA